MTKIQFDILYMLYELKYFSLREYSLKLFLNEDVVYDAYEYLLLNEYLIGNEITEKGMLYLNEHRINNAIILAAGMSTRFVPLNYEIPKGLLEVKGEILIERQIRQLREKGINEIIVVVGYMKEKFLYLAKKYNVIIVETNEYETRNNHSSVYAAKEYLNNSIITSSDLYFSENIFQTFAYDSYYTSIYVSGKTSERGIITDNDDRILKTMYGDKCFDIWVTLGYAFFSNRFSKRFIDILSDIYELPETKGKFWADIQDDYLSDLYMYSKRCSESTIYEFDSLEELRNFDSKYLLDSGSKYLKKIAYLLAVQESEIIELVSLKKIKPSLFRFCCQKNTYICDICENNQDRIIYLGKVYVRCRDFENDSISLYKLNDYETTLEQKKSNTEEEITKLFKYTKDFIDYHKRTVPLCAAENVISTFANLPLNMGFQERYIMNNTYSFNMEDNFIGCEKLYPFYQMISDVCERLFGAKYVDPRPFTGMHCIDMIVKTVCKPGDKMIILDKESGGHASVRPVVERLGIVALNAPYNYCEMDLDYDKLNKMIVEEEVKYILLAPSDIIKPLAIEKIDTSNCVLMWDCSQLMGFIAAGLCYNPLLEKSNIIMFGGTHKTFPGPASGLILTNDKHLHELMERNINPKYLRHSQMHQKISLLFSLIEFEKYGNAYMKQVLHTTNYLGELLKSKGFDVVSVDDKISYTHQIFIRCDKSTMEQMYQNAYKCEITLNKKSKKLFDYYGIRLGTQEISRYGWNDDALKVLADIIKELTKQQIDIEKVCIMKEELPSKTITYTFPQEIIDRFLLLLNT